MAETDRNDTMIKRSERDHTQGDTAYGNMLSSVIFCSAHISRFFHKKISKEDFFPGMWVYEHRLLSGVTLSARTAGIPQAILATLRKGYYVIVRWPSTFCPWPFAPMTSRRSRQENLPIRLSETRASAFSLDPTGARTSDLTSYTYIPQMISSLGIFAKMGEYFP